jgi:hypothetical protein
MFTLQTTSLNFKIMEQSSNHVAVNRLLAAAVVDQNFRRLLLDDPELALRDGYQGEIFPVTPQEHILICSLHARTLPELASQLNKSLWSIA